MKLSEAVGGVFDVLNKEIAKLRTENEDLRKRVLELELDLENAYNEMAGEDI